MANGNHAGPTAQRARHGEPQPAPAAPSSLDSENVPNKRDLASWWKNFKRGSGRREDEKVTTESEPQGIFGVPLQTSVRYANVAISLYDNEGNSYIYGYVPIVVAKCGVFLKEKATDVEGIFRLSGSEKRIKELRTQFNSPDRYGKGLDWSGYTVHDAANILRRYFNQLPEPIIPLEFYDRFRDPLRNHQSEAVGPMDGQGPSVGDFDVGAAIKGYQQLITELPPLNRQLLLYILDLLAVFASKSDLNKMTTPNLAAIFQPGILRHPSHDMAPPEYRLSQDVLIFLIENQDHFLIGMQGTAADSKTVQEVESGPPTPQIRTPGSKTKTLGRSGSSASKYSGIVRRSVSVSSRQSRGSVGPSPVTPHHPPSTPGTNSGGVHRSNTVPSKSPTVGSGRFTREQPSDPPTPGSAKLGLGLVPGSFPEDPDSQYVATHSTQRHLTPPGPFPPSSSGGITPPAVTPNEAARQESEETLHPESQPEKPHLGPIPIPSQGSNLAVPQGQTTPGSATRAAFSNFLTGKPPPGDARKPNKLQKKRVPGSANPSAHSSQSSVAGPEAEGSQASVPVSTASNAPLLNQLAPGKEHPQQLGEQTTPKRASGAVLKPIASPTGSFHSHSTATDPEHAIAYADPAVQQALVAETTRESSDHDASVEKEKKRRWFSRREKETLNNNNNNNNNTNPINSADADRTLTQTGMPPPNPPFASNEPAQRSRSSFASGNEASSARKSVNIDRSGSNAASPESHTAPTTIPLPDPTGGTGTGSGMAEREGREREKNPLHWLKGKLAERAEKKEERGRLKEEARARSPPARDKEHRRGLSGSMQSLTAQMGAAEVASSRAGGSVDIPRDRGQPGDAAGFGVGGGVGTGGVGTGGVGAGGADALREQNFGRLSQPLQPPPHPQPQTPQHVQSPPPANAQPQPQPQAPTAATPQQQQQQQQQQPELPAQPAAEPQKMPEPQPQAQPPAQPPTQAAATVNGSAPSHSPPSG